MDSRPLVIPSIYYFAIIKCGWVESKRNFWEKGGPRDRGPRIISAWRSAISAGRSADPGTGVGVGKGHAAGGQAVDVRGFDLAFGVQSTNIAVLQVIA
jgi:hypothetical protein